MAFTHDIFSYIDIVSTLNKHRGFKALDIQANHQELLQEDIGEYVAQLQLHMALQARNLVPTLNNNDTNNSRYQMLQEAQAVVEKLASRQSLSL